MFRALPAVYMGPACDHFNCGPWAKIETEVINKMDTQKVFEKL